MNGDEVIDSVAILSSLGLGEKLSTEEKYQNFWHTSTYDENTFYMNKIYELKGSLHQEENENFKRALNRLALYNGTCKNLAPAILKHGKNTKKPLPLISKVKNGKILINKGNFADSNKKKLEDLANFLPIEGKSLVATKSSPSNPPNAEESRSLSPAPANNKKNSPRSSKEFEHIKVPKIEHHASSIPNIGRRAAVSLSDDSRLPPITPLKQTRAPIPGKLHKPKTKHRVTREATDSFNLVLGPIADINSLTEPENASNEIPGLKKPNSLTARCNILKSQQSQRKPGTAANANRSVVTYEQDLIRCNSFIKEPTESSLAKVDAERQASLVKIGPTGNNELKSVHKNVGLPGNIKNAMLNEKKKKKKVTFKITKPRVCFLCEHENSKRHRLIIELPSVINDFAMVSRENTLER